MANLASSLLICLTVVACSSNGQSGDDDPKPDAPAMPTVDAAPSTTDAPAGTAATVVPCAGATIAGDIWYYDGIGYVGSALDAELPLGSVVQFHDMSTHTADSPQGLFSASGDDPICVQFDGAGSYGFACYFHSEEVGAIHIVSE